MAVGVELELEGLADGVVEVVDVEVVVARVVAGADEVVEEVVLVGGGVEDVELLEEELSVDELLDEEMVVGELLEDGVLEEGSSEDEMLGVVLEGERLLEDDVLESVAEGLPIEELSVLEALDEAGSKIELVDDVTVKELLATRLVLELDTLGTPLDKADEELGALDAEVVVDDDTVDVNTRAAF